MKRTKICIECNESFSCVRRTTKYCSHACRKYARVHGKERAEKNHHSVTKIHPASVQLLTDATWDFAHSILWNGYPFSSTEIELSKLFIKAYYEEIDAEKFTLTAHKHFTQYCERILLAKEYVSRFAHRYIPHPCIWLNKQNPKGFTGTKEWYQRNLKKRNQIQFCENCPTRCTDSVFHRSGDFFPHNSILNHFHFRA